MNAGDVVVLECNGIESLRSRVEEERVLEVFPCGRVMEVDGVGGEVCAVVGWG